MKNLLLLATDGKFRFSNGVSRWNQMLQVGRVCYFLE